MESNAFNKFIGMKYLLAASYTVNKKSFFEFERYSLTPLQVAAMIDGVDMCRHLVEEGADVNVESEELGATLMHCAALNEQYGVDLLDYFTSLGLRLDARDKFGDEPLQYAIRVNNSKIVQKLLQPNCPEEESIKDKSEPRYRSILHKIMSEQEKGLLNTDLGLNGECGLSEIHLAAMLSDLDMCKWLLNNGADVRSLTKNEYEDSVLHYAAYNKSHGTELVQYFVSVHNFDVNAKDKLGFTPLHFALHMENIETAEELLTLGADLAVKRVTNDSNNLENLMHVCLRWNKKKSAKFLLEKSRNLVYDLRGDGKTSLHIAAEHAGLGMCKWLVDECGLDPRALARINKLSTLGLAACNKSHGKENITFFINNYSLDVKIKNKDGLSPLHQAFLNNNIDAAEELARLGAHLKEKSKWRNLLQFGIHNDKVESGQFLLEKKPVLFAEAGNSIVSLASRHAGDEMEKFLFMNENSQEFNPHIVAARKNQSNICSDIFSIVLFILLLVIAMGHSCYTFLSD